MNRECGDLELVSWERGEFMVREGRGSIDKRRKMQQHRHLAEMSGLKDRSNAGRISQRAAIYRRLIGSRFPPDFGHPRIFDANLSKYFTDALSQGKPAVLWQKDKENRASQNCSKKMLHME